MRKIRVYLDTSVISMIDASYIPEIEAITKDFFRILIERSDEFQAYSSPMGQAEINKSPPEKRTLFEELLHDLNCVYISECDEIDVITQKYLQAGFLTEKHIDDITHLAYAVIAQCDYVVSWNMNTLSENVPPVVFVWSTSIIIIIHRLLLRQLFLSRRTPNENVH